MGKKLKGQEMVFELVMIFGIGVVVMTILYSAFSGYQVYYSSIGTGDSLNKVKQVMTTAILSVAEKQGDSSMVMAIPPRIASKLYVIDLSGSGLNVSTENTYRSSALYGLQQRFSFSGSVPSANGRVTIYKTGSQIIIE